MPFVPHVKRWRLWNDCIAVKSLHHNICSLVRYLKHPLVIALNGKHHAALTYSLREALESWQGPPSAVLQQPLVKVSAASALSIALLCMLSHTAYGEQRELDVTPAHFPHRELPEPCSHLWPSCWQKSMLMRCLAWIRDDNNSWCIAFFLYVFWKATLTHQQLSRDDDRLHYGKFSTNIWVNQMDKSQTCQNMPM